MSLAAYMGTFKQLPLCQAAGEAGRGYRRWQHPCAGVTGAPLGAQGLPPNYRTWDILSYLSHV